MFRQLTPGFGSNSFIRKSLCSTLLMLASTLALSSISNNSQALVLSQQNITLDEGKPVERELSGGQEHIYQITLAEGQYASLIVEQRGIDVLVRVLGEDGKPVAEFDSELRNQGQEPVELVAESAGVYRVVVQAKWPKATAGKYEIRFNELRAATHRDRSLQEARNLLMESTRLFRAGKYDQAISTGERAIEIRESVLGPQHPYIARALNNLAIVYRNTGDFDKAELLHQRALGILEKSLGQEHPDVALTLSNLASVYLNTGNLDKAESLLQRALEVRQKSLGPEHLYVAHSLNILAVILNSRGDLDKAETLYKRAVEIGEKSLGPDHLDTLITLNNLGNLYRDRGELDKAEPIYQRVLEIRQKSLGPDHPSTATSLNNLANIYLDRGELDKAESLYQRALEIRQKALGPDHPDTAASLNNLAIVYRIRGDLDKAEMLYKRALEISEKALGSEHPNVITMINELAITYAAKGDVAQAVTAQSRANAINERNIALNLVTGSERQKLAYLASLSNITDRTLSLHVRLAPGNYEACGLAAATVLRRKGRVLDALADSLAALRQRFSEQDQKLLDQLNEAVARLARLVLNGPQRMTIADHQKQIKALEERREELEAEISRRSAGYYRPSQPVSLAQVQSAIPADAVLIEFALFRPFNPKGVSDKEFGEPRYVVYVIRNQGEVRWTEIGSAREIDDAVEALARALRDPQRKDIEQLARRVDEKLMRPVRAVVGDATRLLISPDGELNLIPFEALVDERGRYLVERYAFTYLTSGRDLLRMQMARENKNKPMVIANPSFDDPIAGQTAKVNSVRKPTARRSSRRSVTTAHELSEIYFAPLAGTAQEARAIQSLFPEAVLLIGRQAAESSLKRATAPRILHIATHGFFLQDASNALMSTEENGTRSIKANAKIDNPLLRSGLALAGANLRETSNDDGILTALEATGLNLWGTKLVVLSACDTGLGEVKNGEGVYGLRRAFVLAGTESLVMSLWPVSDYVTREMMTAYYKGLKQGIGRGEAMRQVQLAMLKRADRAHPFYWAGFIQAGEWANLDGKR